MGLFYGLGLLRHNEVDEKSSPSTSLTLNIWITSIAFHATPTNCILLEVKGFRVRHAIENLAKSADLLTGRAYQ